MSQLRTVLGSAADNFSGTYTRLAELGITALSDGKLSIDDTKLSAALTASYDEVTAVLTVAQGSVGSGLTDVVATSSVAIGNSCRDTAGNERQ